MSGETKKSNRFRKNIKKNWKEITMAFPVFNVFREDVVTNGDGSEETLANAPEQKNGAFKVPKTV